MVCYGIFWSGQLLVDTSVDQIIDGECIFYLISNLLLKSIRNIIILAVGGIS